MRPTPPGCCGSVRTWKLTLCAFTRYASATQTFGSTWSGSSTDKADYSEFLTFVQPPEVSVGYRALGGLAVTLDAGDTAIMNANARIINVQWDMSYDGVRFTATPGYSFQKGMPQMQVTHKFNTAGKVRVACRVQDSRGGEGMWQGEIEVK